MGGYWGEEWGCEVGGKRREAGGQSHAAAQGQWVKGTQPEHTWRAG